MYPSYLESYQNGNLAKITAQAYKLLESCSICPRKCKVNRLKNEKGYCRTGLKPKVYSFMPHFGEEPPISGNHGSGTIFFSECNMSCVYCQNYKFSQLGEGREVEIEELASFMLELQKESCHNINLVTPTHCLPQILKAILIAIPRGLKIPLVYNTGGYELAQIIRLLNGIVDIYLTDMRYANPEIAKMYSDAEDYPTRNQASVKEMHHQTGIAEIDNDGIIKSGLIIRHLVLPNNISGTKEIMQFIANEISPDTYISLMSQYTPYFKAPKIKEIERRISLEEYKKAKKIMDKFNLHNGWTQDSHGLESLAGIHIKPNLPEKDQTI